MGLTLLIPSAKYIPEELQNIGKIPPVLYPLGSGTILDYLLNQYEKNTDLIRIIGFEGYEQLKKKINDLNKKTVELIKIEKLDDLAHTIYAGLKNLDQDVIINFADTFVEENIFTNKCDCFYYSEDDISELWTYFTENNRKLSGIIDKPTETNPRKGKLFTGVFYFTDSTLLKKSLEKAFLSKENHISKFYEAILYYNEIKPLCPKKTEKWFDLGHLDKYYNSKLEVEAREFNHISIDKQRGKLKKTSDDKEKFVGEIGWYLKLPLDIEYCRPRIFSYSMSYNNPYIEMEYYSYHTVHELFLYGNLRYTQWKSVFERIAFVMRDFSKYTVKGENIESSLKEMYLEKTMMRLEKLSKYPEFMEFFEKPIIINNVAYKPLKQIIDILKDIIPANLCKKDCFSIIHGDMCFSNLLIDENYSFIKLIDPRGKFGDFDIYGDPRYDLAKLFHSVDGKYDYIIKNQFSIKQNDNQITFKINSNLEKYDLFELLKQVFSEEIGDQQKNIELIESLLFLSMIPLHNENKKHQMAMLATGIQILDRVHNVKVESNE